MSNSLRSMSTYTFDVDERELHIGDYDLFAPETEVILARHFRLKVVSTSITEDSRAEIRWVQPPSDNLETAFQHSHIVPSQQAEVVRQMNEFWLRVHSPLSVWPSQPALVCLEYTAMLKGSGPDVLYCGAIQPSDYEELKPYLKLENVSKVIRLVAFSKGPFKVYFFDASAQIAYPPPASSNPDLGHERFVYEFSTTLNLKEWERAQYFGIFIQATNA